MFKGRFTPELRSPYRRVRLITAAICCKYRAEQILFCPRIPRVRPGRAGQHIRTGLGPCGARLLGPALWVFLATGCPGDGQHPGRGRNRGIKEKEPPGLLVSSRVGRLGGDSHALESYDVVGVYTRTLQPVESLSPPRVEVGGVEPPSELDCCPLGQWRIGDSNS